ncbi:hypothetical protein ABC337_13840 [Arthrobacter sp. 1P04PC]|uniref:hypothetical protein n=1 Tax=unclassified Arthrobacter TaxID=235627 RepID=UPI0039A2FD38
MDELIKQGQWWWLLLPVATGAFALGGSWLGAHLGRRTEHSQWLRNEKRKAYHEFLKSGHSLAQFLSEAPERWQMLKEDMDVHAKILLSEDIDFFAPKRLDKHLMAFSTAVVGAFAYEESATDGLTREQARKNFDKAHQTLRKAMRKDLGITD